MTRLELIGSYAATVWRWLRAPTLVGVGFLLGFGLPYGYALDRLVRQRFAELTFVQPSRVYARPLHLAVGEPLTPDALLIELQAARYRESENPFQPGTWSRNGATFEIAVRAFRAVQGAVPERRIRVTLAKGRVSAVLDADNGSKLGEAWIDPARIATLYGPRQEERRFVRVAEVPPLLVAALQAVEDRDFKHHLGIDPWAILRAAWVNLSAGEVLQGGSTLTQQLVRNLFLDRSQTFLRKFNEAALALLIEARFGKDRILEAYLNEVYLGQQGAQAVHGVAAASEFYFGRDLSTLSIQDTALLIGLIQGPSLHDPRRYPDRAILRRNVVLKVMQDTGLINAMDRTAAGRAPLGVVGQGALAKNRYPGFLDLVRAQLRSDFPEAKLRSEGLAVLTTLSPSAQRYAEDAVASRIKALGKQGEALQAAVVLTQSRTGAIEAVVSGRNADEPGFNRALLAARPIGSLVKPFVYLVALAQPGSWSLMSVVPDTALSLRQPNGKIWSPANIDNTEHGEVLLIDALARSYNLATVRLGLEVDVGKIERVLEALVPGADISPHPSMLLGATDLSPLQVTQAYQYLAADGKPLAVYGVEAVLDAQGRALSRYTQVPPQGDLVSASRLVTFALQETVRSGTAASLNAQGLGWLHAAGKTGTSNDQRDSWFAGYTGSHLAVVWLGADDNRGIGLYGATGALRVWSALFAKLPTTPLAPDFAQDPQFAWVDATLQRAVDSDCDGARQLPFIRGYGPPEASGCGGFGFGSWFDRDDEEDDFDHGKTYQDEETRSEERGRRHRRLRDWFRRRNNDDDEREDETM